MTAWTGAFGLALGFCAAVVGAGSWARSAVTGRPPVLGRGAVLVCLLSCLTAVLALEVALVRHDFSVRFVAENGSRSTPLYYTITSLWAAHDGSLLLWTLILTGYLAVLTWRRGSTDPQLHAWAVAVVAVVAAFFSGLALLTGGVFDTVSPVPSDGPGPTPLLADHPAMGVHPPLLYLGLVGLVVPFAFAVAALVTGRLDGPDGSWLHAVRPYVRTSWTALTAGIVLGAWWSYAVLGWGGYWAWDPVENSSLMPWLLLTALLHSAMVQRRRGALPVWNLSLAIAAFLLAALGVLLTRSGLVSSVHSFADSGVGPVLLGFLAAALAAVVALVCLRTGRLGRSRSVGPPTSRGAALLLNNVLLVVLTVTVLLGTVWPVLVEAATGDRLSVGPPYYDRMAVPLVLGLLLLMVVGPLLAWGGGALDRLVRRLWLPVLVGCGVAAAVRFSVAGSGLVALVCGLSAVVVVGAVVETVTDARRPLGPWLRRNRPRLAGRVVHVGFAVLAVGVAASSAFTASTEHTLAPGDSAELRGATITLEQVHRARDDREMRTSASLDLQQDGATRTIEPALRFFLGRQTTVASPEVVSGLGRDVYVTLLSVDPDRGTATVRLAVNPMVGWIWAGGALMVLGSLLAVRRPRRRARGAAGALGAAGEPVHEPGGQEVVPA